MSKITAELEVKAGGISGAVKGVAAKIENALAPLKKNQVAFARLGNSLKPLTGIAMGVAGGVAMVGGAALAAGGAIAVGVKKAFDLGGELSDLSARTGITAGKLMVLQQAFKDNGLSADQVGPAINRMQKALSGANEDGSSTAEAFAQLGLSMDELNAMSPDQQFKKVSGAISGISDPTQRAALAMKIFGRSGGEMLALFSNSGALGAAAGEVGTQAAIMDRNAALFDDISDKLNLASLKMQGFFVGVADYVAPVLQPLLDWFASQDLAAQGQQFGLYIATAIQMLTDGTMLTAFGDTLLLMAGNFVNAIANGINAVIQTLASVPGFGAVANLQIPTIDTSVFETDLGNTIIDAMDKVEAARAAADAAVKPPGPPPGEGTVPSTGGEKNKLGIKQFFATSAGLFVKDPILGEARKSNELLKEIKTGIQNLKLAAGSGGMRFT